MQGELASDMYGYYTARTYRGHGQIRFKSLERARHGGPCTSYQGAEILCVLQDDGKLLRHWRWRSSMMGPGGWAHAMKRIVWVGSLTGPSEHIHSASSEACWSLTQGRGPGSRVRRPTAHTVCT